MKVLQSFLLMISACKLPSAWELFSPVSYTLPRGCINVKAAISSGGRGGEAMVKCIVLLMQHVFTAQNLHHKAAVLYFYPCGACVCEHLHVVLDS